MDEELSDNIRRYIYSKTYGKSGHFNSFMSPVNTWLPIIDEDKDYLTLEFKGVKCDQDQCHSKISENLTFNKQKLLEDIAAIYFINSKGSFYQISKYTFDDTFLELKLIPVNLETYFDYIPEEIKMIIMSFLNEKDIQELIRIKYNFISDPNTFWNRLAGYRFGKWYLMLTDEIDKRGLTWKYVYPKLAELTGIISIDDYMMNDVVKRGYHSAFAPANLIIYEQDFDILKILNRVKLRLDYPYVSKLDLPDDYVGLILSINETSSEEAQYLKTGVLESDRFPYEIIKRNPRVLYDFVTNSNFILGGNRELLFILNVLSKETNGQKDNLFNKYILKLNREHPEILVNFVHNFDYTNLRYIYDPIVIKIQEIVGII